MSGHPMLSQEIRSMVTADSQVHLSLQDVRIGPPADDEVVVRVDAAPLNPSDLWVLLGAADLSTLHAGGTPGHPTATATVPAHAMGRLRHRVGQSLPVGNEGAGTVVRVGADAHLLLGQRVAMIGGGMYTHLRRLPAAQCVKLADDISTEQGAASHVNPMTALAMVECLHRDGHRALVHTAAASNLGQMLNRLCVADGIALVNVVRSAEQAARLHDAGAAHVLNSTLPDFEADLADAIAATGATLAFDAVGGGQLTDTVLKAMEHAATRHPVAYHPYGSRLPKQVYIYGSLDRRPTTLDRSYGMAWSVSGFLLDWFLDQIGPTETARLRARVAAELRTTFASQYSGTLSLVEALHPDNLRRYAQRSTNSKYLIVPSRIGPSIALRPHPPRSP